MTSSVLGSFVLGSVVLASTAGGVVVLPPPPDSGIPGEAVGRVDKLMHARGKLIAMSSIIRPGDTVNVKCSFDVGGVATDPSTVELRIKDPAGTVTTYTYAATEVTRDAVGVFHKSINLPDEGTWHWRWAGTGTCASTDEGKIVVRDSVFF